MNLKNKSILVTGGTGFIGSHLVDRLIKEGPEKIIVISNSFSGREENLTEAKNFSNLKIYEGDLSEYESTKKIIEENGIDIVYNLAVIPLISSLEKPEWTFKQIIEMSLSLCRLAREDSFKRLSQFSSSEAYGTAKYIPMNEVHPLNPETPYAAGKASTDHLALSYGRTFGIDVAVVRPFNNYGPRQNTGRYAAIIPLTIARMMKNEPVIINGNGLQTRDFIYVTDTAEATVQISKSNDTRHMIINVASGKETTIKEILTLIAKNMNYNKEFVYKEARPGDVRRHFADISLIEKLIGFKPMVNLEEGIKLTTDWYKKEKENIGL